MQITDVKVITANRCVFAKVITDEGIYGIGEAGAWGFLEASAAAINTLKGYLVGKIHWILNITGNICSDSDIFGERLSWRLFQQSMWRFMILRESIIRCRFTD